MCVPRIPRGDGWGEGGRKEKGVLCLYFFKGLKVPLKTTECVQGDSPAYVDIIQ